MARNTSRLKNTDFEILYTGESIRKGVLPTTDSPPFGETEKDYIEMIISTTTGTILETFVVAKGNKVNEHFDSNGEFVKINPGIFMREKGYFSGEYNIEFNFLREVAGSTNNNVLLTQLNKVWEGPTYVDDDGNILETSYDEESETNIPTTRNEDNSNLLREVSLKYYIDEISSDRTEVRLLPFSIDDKIYNEEFKGIGKDKVVLTYDNELDILDNGNNEFRVLNYETMDDKLKKQLVGGELIISDAYEIIDLTDIEKNVDFLVGDNVEHPSNLLFGSFRTWGSNWRGLVKSESKKNPNHIIHGGDNNYYVDIPNKYHLVPALRGGYIPDFVLTADKRDVDNSLFERLGNGYNEKYTSGVATENFISKRNSLRPDRFLGGAAIIGFQTYRAYGFPLWIRAKGELTRLKGAELTIDIDGEVIGGANGAFETKFTGQETTKFDGENTFIRITTPMDTTGDTNNARAGVLVNLSVKFKHPLWSGVIERKNVFGIYPDDNKGAAELFVNAGFNGGRR